MAIRRRIGILTGGGDCPGLNAVIRAAVKATVLEGSIDVIGFVDGFRGLVDNDTIPLTYDAVSNILTQGGTILGTSNQDNFFGVRAGPSQTVPAAGHRLADALRTVQMHQLQGLICIGGDGTLTVAHHLHRQGIPIVGVPKTIDNDVPRTDQTFGFDSATTIATEAIDRLHSTAASHHRVMVVEVMGRYAGWIALHAGIAGGGDVILLPEIPFTLEALCDVVLRRSSKGRRFSIVVVAEGARTRTGTLVTRRSTSRVHPQRLGGIGHRLAADIEARTRLESRATVLGHLQRGGTPTPFDRVLATRFGHMAACLVLQRRYGQMVCLRGQSISTVPLRCVAGRPKTIPRNAPLLAVARSIGVSFGDRRIALTHRMR